MSNGRIAVAESFLEESDREVVLQGRKATDVG
jgi:hypothetical protein